VICSLNRPQRERLPCFKSGIAVTGEADLHCEDLKFARLDLGGNMRDAFSHLCDITAKNFADFAELRKEHVVAPHSIWQK
jgi:hypothetical protein